MLKIAVFLFCMLFYGSNAGMCPSYSSVKDFDPSKITGTWYLLSGGSFGWDRSLSCGKVNLTITDDGKVKTDAELIAIDGTAILETDEYTADPDHLGDILSEEEVEDTSIFGSEKRKVEVRTSTVYVDYDNIIALFTCVETKNNLFPTATRVFSIFVRDRSFNSLSKFGMALGELAKLGVDLNDVNFMYNGPNCKN